MKRSSLPPFLMIIAALTLYVISCAPEACYEETNAFVKATMLDNDTKLNKAPDSLTVYGIGRDTVMIYNKSAKVQPVMLPLNDSTSTCTFVVRINGITDTVTITYTSFPHLISKECGYTFYHRIDTPVYTRHIIDYIFTADKNITTENVENLRIFY